MWFSVTQAELCNRLSVNVTVTHEPSLLPANTEEAWAVFVLLGFLGNWVFRLATTHTYNTRTPPLSRNLHTFSGKQPALARGRKCKTGWQMERLWRMNRRKRRTEILLALLHELCKSWLPPKRIMVLFFCQCAEHSYPEALFSKPNNPSLWTSLSLSTTHLPSPTL